MLFFFFLLSEQFVNYSFSTVSIEFFKTTNLSTDTCLKYCIVFCSYCGIKCDCLCCVIVCASTYKGFLFLLLFSGGIDSSQPAHSVSQNVPFTQPGVGTSAASAVMSSVRSPAPSLSSKPPSSPSVTQSPELALQEGTKREWEVTLQAFAIFHMHT